MLMLVAGLALFFAAHSLTMRRDLRASLVARLGEVPYKIVYSAASLAGLLLIVYGYGGYRAHGWIEVWNPPTFMRHIALALMPFAFIALIAAYAPGRIKQALKHPMLVAIKIWALSHLLANGDLGSILLFGTFLAYAVVDRISMKRRVPQPAPAMSGGIAGDAVAVIGGLALYLAFLFWLHTWLIGVPVLTRG